MHAPPGPMTITAQPPEDPAEPQEPTAPDDIGAVEIRVDVEALLHRAPADVAEGLRRLYLEDQPMQDAAEAMGVSRFVLSRKLAGYAETVRAAA